MNAPAPPPPPENLRGPKRPWIKCEGCKRWDFVAGSAPPYGLPVGWKHHRERGGLCPECFAQEPTTTTPPAGGTKVTRAALSHGGVCPSCGGLTQPTGTCFACPSCGWSGGC